MKTPKLFFMILLFAMTKAYSAIGDQFMVNGVKYEVTSNSPLNVKVIGEDDNYLVTTTSPNKLYTILTIPSTVSYSLLTFTVTAIGDKAFSGNITSFNYISIPVTVTSIGKSAFQNNVNLKMAIVPSFKSGPLSSMVSIGDDAFNSCISLETFDVGYSVTSSSSSAFIGDRAFFNCTALQGISLPSAAKSIGDYAFYSCIVLPGVFDKIPPSVLSIGARAFYRVFTRTYGHGGGYITLPASVTYIGDYAFEGCDNVVEIISLNPTPPALGENVFKDVTATYSNYLVVPFYSVLIYAGANQWKDFKHYSTLATDDAAEKNTVPAAYPNPVKDVLHFSPDLKNVRIYTADGRPAKENISGNETNVATLPKGLYILTGTNKNGKKVSQKIIKE